VLYLTALGKEGTVYSTENAIAAEQLYVQATAIDPKFALAYGRASLLNTYLSSNDEYRERKAKARAQAEEALRLSPTLGEAHMALGLCLCWGEKKYDEALKEFEVATATSPNNAEIYNYVAGIYRRKGRWRDSVASYERALSLDPRNPEIAFYAANNHLFPRDWAAASAGYTRALEIKPDYVLPKIAFAYLELFRNGNPAAGRRSLQDIPARLDPSGRIALTRWDMSMMERNYAAAEKILTDFPLDDAKASDGPKTFYQGRTALARGDFESSQRYFAAAAPAFEGWVGDDPDDGQRHARLGLLYAYMHKNEDALRESHRAVELEPESHNAFHGALCAANLALVYALVGEQDQAITLIERLLPTPGPVSYPDYPQNITLADLRLRWEWDSLRSNPRFQKILAGPESKAALTNIAQTTPAAPEKSIAVLPFENLSDDKQNGYLAAGVQDEILTHLAKIADLKVISRKSVIQYKSSDARNLREIGQELGVAHVVEGSVQRVADRVRVNAQLIDTRTEAHLWAETYDRDLADVFSIQSEIAQKIADQLSAKLSPNEKSAIEERPTKDLKAYQLYIEANAIWDWNSDLKETATRQIELLEGATRRDPGFALAYCSLANAHRALFILGDHKQLDLMKQAADTAVRLRPDLGEAHLVRASYCFLSRDFNRAHAELSLARHTLPNSPEALLTTARIDRRQNRWDDALAAGRQASDLDPRNGEIFLWVCETLDQMRRYGEEEQWLQQGLSRLPELTNVARAHLANLKLDEGDPVAAREVLAQIPQDFSYNEDPWVARFMTALYLRDYDEASRVIATTPANFRDAFVGQSPQSWADGQIARARSDKLKAQGAFAAARQSYDATWSNVTKDESYFAQIAALDAGLGRKEKAIREAKHAVELMPISRDSFIGPGLVGNLALVYAWTGERDLALEQLETVAKIPFGPSYGDLRFNPCWDSLRGDQRFEKIVADLKPPNVGTAH
jgi:TolB-like protein/Tfp pilus assembly protein PilF